MGFYRLLVRFPGCDARKARRWSIVWQAALCVM
jgi:hypothetical protein